MELQYELIGKRIRLLRKSKKLSQGKLAELTNFSTPHIGHIETATTKLSITALVEIANALEVTPDQLLSDVIYQSKEYLNDDFAKLFEDCTSNELYIILQIAQATKEALRTKKIDSTIM